MKKENFIKNINLQFLIRTNSDAIRGPNINLGKNLNKFSNAQNISILLVEQILKI